MSRIATGPFGRLNVELLESRDVPSGFWPDASIDPPDGPPVVSSRSDGPKSDGPRSPDSERFVTHLYQDILLRQPEPSGLAGWVNLLDSGTITRNQAAIAFITCDEYRINTIRSYYTNHLGRSAENSEVQHFLNRFYQGESQDSIRVSFFGSEEFFNRYARNNNEFIAQLYIQILGRAASGAEVAAWVNILNQSGGNRSGVAAAFLNSGEYYQVQVNFAYNGLLFRAPDGPGFNYWVGQRAAGVTIEAVLASFLACDEYYRRG